MRWIWPVETRKRPNKTHFILLLELQNTKGRGRLKCSHLERRLQMGFRTKVWPVETKHLCKKHSFLTLAVFQID